MVHSPKTQFSTLFLEIAITTWIIHLALQSFSFSTPSRPLFSFIPPKLLTSMTTTGTFHYP